MTSFKDVSELQQHLKVINPEYGQYAAGLFPKGVTSSSGLMNASLAVWVECGVTSVQHVEDIRARSEGKGKSDVSACSYWPEQVLDFICRACIALMYACMFSSLQTCALLLRVLDGWFACCQPCH